MLFQNTEHFIVICIFVWLKMKLVNFNFDYQKRDFFMSKKFQRGEIFFFYHFQIGALEKGHQGESNAVSTIFLGLLVASVAVFEVE